MSVFSGGRIKKLISKLTAQLEQFLRACKSEGNTTIDDVLKRLEDLKLSRAELEARIELFRIVKDNCKKNDKYMVNAIKINDLVAHTALKLQDNIEHAVDHLETKIKTLLEK